MLEKKLKNVNFRKNRTMAVEYLVFFKYNIESGRKGRKV